MSAIGRIQQSLASASQETTLALANFNFDFALWKVEAPPSYKPLGESLSLQRRSAAENGMPHAIARRLGSLFEGILPRTPSLITAYGTRASEISTAPGTIPSRNKEHGPFEKFVGFDGTSIWAAATSGPCSVAVHLLACMLARVWPAAEAVSIWEELVIERKRSLVPEHDADEQSIPTRDAVAVQLVITKEQLAELDASARAWLRAADASSTVQGYQRDLTKLLKSVSLPVGTHPRVYENVCKVWTTALSSFDKLVQGIPYSIQDGDVLLALSSWHLYPDVIVLGSRSLELRLNDPLIAPGGDLTIGIQDADAGASLGVHWSLSLAHLRYYGAPVLAHGTVDSQSNRLTFPQFLLVTLGAVISAWAIPISQLREAAQLVKLMSSHLREGQPSGFAAPSLDWLRPLDSAASELIASPDGDRDGPSKLVRLGYRRQHFLTSARPNNVFNLCTVDLGCILHDFRDQIDFYQTIFQNWDRSEVPLVLRVLSGKRKCLAFITVVPVKSGTEGSHTSHRGYVTEGFDAEDIGTMPSSILRQEDVIGSFSWKHFQWRRAPPWACGREGAKPENSASLKKRSGWLHRNRGRAQALPPSDELGKETFEFVAGDLERVSLYCASGFLEEVRHYGDSRVGLQTLAAQFEERKIRATLVEAHFKSLANTNEAHLLKGCLAIAHAARLYEGLPGATISPKVLDARKPVCDLVWAASLLRSESGSPGDMPQRIEMSREVAFSCVAYFESGLVATPSPYALTNVMAISSGDSLYIAAPLLGDPATNFSPFEIHRVMGNIGRAGLAFLIPPKNPMVRPRSSDWTLVNHEPFNGKLEDNFRSTSLTLRFTGYEYPLILSEHGGRFVEGLFIEVVVSVYESGRWMADLNVLDSLASPDLYSLVQQDTCRQSSPAGSLPAAEVISLDSWEELLDPPSTTSVIRAHGNWQARLAAASISVMLGHPTILFTDHGCWTCAIEAMAKFGVPVSAVPDSPDSDADSPAAPEAPANFVFVL